MKLIRGNMNKIIILALVLTASVANALTLSQAVNQFGGTEITASGEIGVGVMSETDLSFKSSDGTFDVLLDAGRKARKSLAGCKFTFFSGANCKADIKAEIKVKGNSIKLIVYEVNNLMRIQKQPY